MRGSTSEESNPPGLNSRPHAGRKHWNSGSSLLVGFLRLRVAFHPTPSRCTVSNQPTRPRSVSGPHFPNPPLRRLLCVILMYFFCPSAGSLGFKFSSFCASPILLKHCPRIFRSRPFLYGRLLASPKPHIKNPPRLSAYKALPIPQQPPARNSCSVRRSPMQASYLWSGRPRSDLRW